MPSPEPQQVLDFTRGGKLPPILMRQLDELACSLRPAFNTMIDEIGARHPRNIDWWVSLPASRNTHNSELFGKCVQLALAQNLTEAGATIVVRTDDASQQAVLRSAGFTVMKATGVPKWRSILHGIASSVYHAISAWSAARATRSLTRSLLPNSTLVEIYLLRDSFGPEGLRDRYYPGLHESLDANQRSRVFYLPIFYRIRDYGALFGQLRRAPQNFLLREDYLRWRDYAFAFGHWLRAGRLKGLRARFAGFDIGPLLDAEIDRGRFSNAVCQALLIYRFWRYRASAGCASLLDWYEGHDIDHATAAGIKWHGNKTRLVAMRPLAPDSYLSLTPTPGEVDANVIPAEWMVVGQERRTRMAGQFPTLSVGSAPGLRHRELLNATTKGPGLEPRAVLVMLSIEPHLVRLVAGIIEEASRIAQDFHWLVKRHPGLPREEVEKIFHGVAGITLVEGSFIEVLAKADIVTGLGTNTLIEAAALGVPVICISGGNMPTELPFSSEDEVWWRVAYDADALLEAVRSAPERLAAPPAGRLEQFLGPFDPAILHEIISA